MASSTLQQFVDNQTVNPGLKGKLL